MAYSTSNPPLKIAPGALDGNNFNGAGQIWTYSSPDSDATVKAAGYITNGVALGMQPGDIVFVEVATAGSINNSTFAVTQPIPTALYMHFVLTVNANGTAVDLSQTPASST